MKLKSVDLEMEYIGWNMGQRGHKRNERKGDIDLLVLKIDAIDVLKELEKAEKWDRRAKAGCVCDERHNAEQKLEAVKDILLKAKPDDPYVGEAKILQEVADELDLDKAFTHDRGAE